MDKPQLREVTPPVKIEVKISTSTARRLGGLVHQALGARAVAKAAEQAAQAAEEAWQQAALVVFESKYEGKLPVGDFGIEVDPVENRVSIVQAPAQQAAE